MRILDVLHGLLTLLISMYRPHLGLLVLGFRMAFVDHPPIVLHQNMSSNMQEIDLSNELTPAKICSEFPMLRNA